MRRTLAERFVDKYVADPRTGCHVWTGATSKGGYGAIGVMDGGKSRPRRAPRVAWMLHHGPIPPGLVVRHRCDNPACVRVDHLQLGTVADNAHDKVRRGRSLSGERHSMAKLARRDVESIRDRCERGKRGIQRRLAREYGVSEATISNIVKGKSWKALNERAKGRE